MGGHWGEKLLEFGAGYYFGQALDSTGIPQALMSWQTKSGQPTVISKVLSDAVAATGSTPGTVINKTIGSVIVGRNVAIPAAEGKKPRYGGLAFAIGELLDDPGTSGLGSSSTVYWS